MKKQFLAMVLAGALALSFISCTKKEETTAAATTAAASAETTTAAAETTTAASETPSLTKEDYNYMLNEQGLIDGYTASDYVDIPDLAKVSFKKSDYQLTDDEMDYYLSNLTSYLATEVTDRAVEDQDYVSIDYVGYVDGKTSDGMQATDSVVQAGTDQFIDDFLYQIIGHKPGDKFDVEVTFPDPYENNTDLSGKDAVFTVTINYIYEVPELTDAVVTENLAFVQEYFNNTDIKTVQDIKDFINDYYFESEYESGIYSYFYKNLTLKKDLDDALTSYGKNYLNCSFVSSYSMTIEQIIANNDLDANYFDEQIIAETKMALFFQAIAEKQGFTVSREDMEEYFGADYVDTYIETYGQGYMSCILLQRKAMAYIREQVKLEQ